MPYPNFHAARVRPPGEFSRIRVLQTLPNGVLIYGGPLKGKTTSTAQSYRFPKSKFTPEQAKAWLKKHNVKVKLFEPAKKDEIEFDNEDILDFSKYVFNDEGWEEDTNYEDYKKKLLRREKGRCQYCGKGNIPGDKWKVHHRKPRNEGGSDKFSNLCLLHLSCHSKIHKEGLLNKVKKNKDEMDIRMQNVDRMDILMLPDEEPDNWMEEKFVRTPEGYLKGRAIVTNIGVFTYRNADGTVTKELRLPEEVFDPESMDSLRMVPLTHAHPGEKVDTSNIKELQVGNAGDNVRRDELHLSMPMVVTGDDAIMDIEVNGKKAISCAYKVDIEDRSGTWLGIPFDVIQRNIRYNHIAVGIEQGRAGDAAKMKLDSEDGGEGAYCTEYLDGEPECYEVLNSDTLYKEDESQIKEEVSNMALKKVKLDDIEYDAEETVIKALNDAKKEVETLTTKVDTLEKEKEDWGKEKTTLEAERDDWKDKHDQLEKDKEKEDDGFQEKIDTAVKSRIDLVQTAKDCGVEVDKEDSDRAIKEKVICKAYPQEDEDADKAYAKALSEKEDSYINARFDGAVESLKGQEDKDKKNKEDISDTTSSDKNKNKEDKEDLTSDEARDKMINDMKDRSKIKE